MNINYTVTKNTNLVINIYIIGIMFAFLEYPYILCD